MFQYLKQKETQTKVHNLLTLRDRWNQKENQKEKGERRTFWLVIMKINLERDTVYDDNLSNQDHPSVGEYPIVRSPNYTITQTITETLRLSLMSIEDYILMDQVGDEDYHIVIDWNYYFRVIDEDYFLGKGNSIEMMLNNEYLRSLDDELYNISKALDYFHEVEQGRIKNPSVDIIVSEIIKVLNQAKEAYLFKIDEITKFRLNNIQINTNDNKMKIGADFGAPGVGLNVVNSVIDEISKNPDIRKNIVEAEWNLMGNKCKVKYEDGSRKDLWDTDWEDN